MTKTLPKLVLSSSRDIPFSQLVLSQKNVRRVIPPMIERFIATDRSYAKSRRAPHPG